MFPRSNSTNSNECISCSRMMWLKKMIRFLPNFLVYFSEWLVYSDNSV